jgi:hypothetical protein
VILRSLAVPAEEFERGTGWAVGPEGACRGPVCVPLPAMAAAGTTVDVAAVADRLGMALLGDERHGLWALGPATPGAGGGLGLESVEAPDLVLPDVDGRPFRLRSLRGQKVVLVAWASW